MNSNFEAALPEGYREAMVIDAKDKKFAVRMNIAASVISVAGVLLSWLLTRPLSLDVIMGWRYWMFMGLLLAYIVMHELTHGIAYYLLTRHKLTFGLTLSVAYCGVPDIYVYRKTALISLLAPFTVYTVVFLSLAFLLPLAEDRFLFAVLFSIHFGGCAGDLYDTFVYLTRFKDASVLMRDTGPCQTFYVKD